MPELYNDPRAEEELAKMEAYLRNFSTKGYCIDKYAEFHGISKEEASAILNGCGALDDVYQQDIVIIGHWNMATLISVLRRKVERLGGVNPPAVLPKQMGYETVTELYPD